MLPSVFRRKVVIYEKKDEKKELLRTQIVTAAKVYERELVNRVFLYVFGSEYIEVIFRTDDFLHLTGVGTALYSRTFY